MTLLQPPSNLVLIDSAVEDYQILINSVTPETAVVLIDSQQDGIAQITAALAKYSQLQSLHIVSHGNPGELYLGSTRLNWSTLDRHLAQIQSWADALKQGADLLLYGCQVAAGRIGAAFVDRLAHLLGVNLAASTNRTGHPTLGGDWILEQQIGSVTVPLAFSTAALAAYPGILEPIFSNFLYAINSEAGEPSFLRVLDIGDASSTLVPPPPETPIQLPFRSFTLAREANTGQLYFIEEYLPGQNDNNIRLASYNPITNTITALPNLVGVNTSVNVNFLKMAQAQDGTIYAMDQTTTNLYRIDTDGATAGQVTLLGAVAGIVPGSGDLAFNPDNPNEFFVTSTQPNGTLYQLFRVDISNPFAPIGTLVGNVTANGAPLSPAGSGALAFGSDGGLYTSSTNGLYLLGTPDTPTTPGQVTAIATRVGDLNFTANDFASLPTPTPLVDVAVAIADNVTTIAPGSPITFTITVTNLPNSDFSGNQNIQGIPINSLIPPEITNVTWVGSIPGGQGDFPTPNDQSGTGNTINTQVNLIEGGSVTYTVTGIVSPTATPGSFLTVTAGLDTEGLIDPDLSNNTITVPLAQVIPNQPPIANDTSVVVSPGITANIPGISAIDPDPDGSIVSFTILTVPPADQGTVFLGNPATGGTAIAAGQVLTPTQINQVFFQPAPNFSGTTFTYTATDNRNTSDPTPATVTLIKNQPPRVTDSGLSVRPNNVVPVTGVSATDPDGTIQSITITTLPPADQGILFLGDPATGGVPIQAGQALTPDQATQLFFQANPDFEGGTFTFTATDNLGATAATPATLTLALRDCEPGVRRNGGQTSSKLKGTEDIDTLQGGRGDDVLRGLDCPDLLKGNQDRDRIFGNAAEDTLNGGLARDTLIGGAAGDRLVGGRADDRLRGQSGNDTGKGGVGNDRMGGAPGNDVLDGGKGKDNILGGNGDDVIRGNQDNDVINAGADHDSVIGGLGIDNIRGRQGDDTVRAGRGDDLILGGPDNDQINGNQLDDVIRAHAGNDSLRGGNDRDRISGGQGNDVILGGLGKDSLLGGGGSDRFIYTRVREREDIIRDFKVSQNDVIDLRGITTRPKFGSDNFFEDYIQLQRISNGTAVRIESSGDRPGERFRTLAVLEGVRSRAIGADSFLFT